jgi:hypothetical protein
LLRYHWLAFKAEGDWVILPKGWLDSIRAAVLTGFAQVEQISSDSSVLFVPCHFGGTPWMVMCYEVSGDESARASAAYQIYRDLGSRVNTAIRLLGQASFAEELKILFSFTLAGNFIDPVKIRTMVIEEWAKLAAIYPITPPILGKATGNAARGEYDYLLKFPDGDWLLQDSHEGNWFVRTTPPFEQGQGESWSSSLGELVKDNFIRTVAYELRSEAAQMQEAVSDATYAAAHAVGHRLGELEGGVNALCIKVKENWGSDINTLNAAKSVHKSVKVCKRAARLMNFMRAVRNSDGGALLKEKFLTLSSYRVEAAFPEIFRTFVAGQEKTVSVEAGVLKRKTVQIVSFQTSWGNYRPFDVLYDELFFELLFNAAKFSVCAELELDQGAAALILSNKFSKDRIAGGTVIGKWEDCRGGRPGGLRFLADCLFLSGSGMLETKIEESLTEYVFFVRIRLTGLTF